MNQYYNSYSDYLKKKYGEKVYKLPINLDISCPNRKGGKGGCSFCSESGTGFESRPTWETVSEQLEKNRLHIQNKYKAYKFIAYFQNYTNTYMPLERFQKRILEAAVFPGIVGISISTRPDCILVTQLEFLKQVQIQYGIHISFELGLQTVNYNTLDKINRGHGLGAYLASVLLIRDYHFPICTHVILNLPGDTMRDCMELADVLSSLPIQIIKIHSLYIPRNTKLSYDYINGKIKICSKEEYLERLSYFIGHIRNDIVIERLFSRIPEADCEFCNWGVSWWRLRDEFEAKMEEEECWQGKYYIPSNEAGFRETVETKETN